MLFIEIHHPNITKFIFFCNRKLISKYIYLDRNWVGILKKLNDYSFILLLHTVSVFFKSVIDFVIDKYCKTDMTDPSTASFKGLCREQTIIKKYTVKHFSQYFLCPILSNMYNVCRKFALHQFFLVCTKNYTFIGKL